MTPYVGQTPDFAIFVDDHPSQHGYHVMLIPRGHKIDLGPDELAQEGRVYSTRSNATRAASAYLRRHAA